MFSLNWSTASWIKTLKLISKFAKLKCVKLCAAFQLIWKFIYCFVLSLKPPLKLDFFIFCVPGMTFHIWEKHECGNSKSRIWNAETLSIVFTLHSRHKWFEISSTGVVVPCIWKTEQTNMPVLSRLVMMVHTHRQLLVLTIMIVSELYIKLKYTK